MPIDTRRSLDRRAKFARRRAGDPFEYDTHVFGMAKAAAVGDGFEREIGVVEQLLHPINLHAQNFLMRRVANRLPKSRF